MPCNERTATRATSLAPWTRRTNVAKVQLHVNEQVWAGRQGGPGAVTAGRRVPTHHHKKENIACFRCGHGHGHLMPAVCIGDC